MNKKYILIGAVALIAAYFIYKKFTAKKTESAESTESAEKTLSPLALKPKPNLPVNPYGIISDSTKPEFNPMESGLTLENKYNSYC